MSLKWSFHFNSAEYNLLTFLTIPRVRLKNLRAVKLKRPQPFIPAAPFPILQLAFNNSPRTIAVVVLLISRLRVYWPSPSTTRANLLHCATLALFSRRISIYKRPSGSEPSILFTTTEFLFARRWRQHGKNRSIVLARIGRKNRGIRSTQLNSVDCLFARVFILREIEKGNPCILTRL